jgi:phosphoribosylformylglycinamidine synthase
LAAHAYWFGEDQGRYLLEVEQDHGLPELIIERAQAAGVPVKVVGYAGDAEEPVIDASPLFSLPLSRLREAHEGWLPRYMGEPG